LCSTCAGVFVPGAVVLMQIDQAVILIHASSNGGGGCVPRGAVLMQIFQTSMIVSPHRVVDEVAMFQRSVACFHGKLQAVQISRTHCCVADLSIPTNVAMREQVLQTGQATRQGCEGGRFLGVIVSLVDSKLQAL
jgi:hypothetical protein